MFDKPREETLSIVMEEFYERFDRLNLLLERIALALEKKNVSHNKRNEV